jgi:hypothetical protein
VSTLATSSPRSVGTVYVFSAVDRSGRVADRSIVRALAWAPGTRLDIRERTGVMVVRAATDGVHRISDRGHLLLPLAARRWCRITTGDRLLLAADPATGLLMVHPLPVLDRLLAEAHAAAAGGGAP